MITKLLVQYSDILVALIFLCLGFVFGRLTILPHEIPTVFKRRNKKEVEEEGDYFTERINQAK